jgi:hypothetical protein
MPCRPALSHSLSHCGRSAGRILAYARGRWHTPERVYLTGADRRTLTPADAFSGAGGRTRNVRHIKHLRAAVALASQWVSAKHAT